MEGESASARAANAQRTALIGSLARRLWHSPTVTTWGSTVSRVAGLLVILPLVLTRFSAPEIAVWYLLSSIISLQTVADAGFAPTFQRVFAYAVGGAAELSGFRERSRATADGRANLELLARIWSTAQLIYNRLTVGGILILGSFGTWALRRPITGLADPLDGWLAWIAVLTGTACVLRGNSFAAYLQGSDRIALVKRWETFTSLGGALTSIIVLLLGGRLLALAIAVQSWSVINALRDWLLCRRVQREQFGHPIPLHPANDPSVLSVVWPAAWRSAVGIGMSRGVVYASGLVYAQIADASSLASYLLAIRLVTAVSEVSQAPFYSKLPRLAQLISTGRQEEMVALARKGMALAFWAFVVPFVAIGVSGPTLIRMIHSHAPFAPQLLWSLIGVAFFLERYGAMHLQLYSTTNHIVWHIANGVSGALNISVIWLLFPIIGVYAFPAGLIISLLGFYCWYSARYSYKTFGMRFSAFERRTSFLPSLALVTYLCIATLLSGSH